MPSACFLGTSGGISFAQLGFDDAHFRVGNNLGNLLFQYSFWSAVRNPKMDYFFRDGPRLEGTEFDVLVMPAANQINPAWDLGWWADFIERINKPIVVAGLGAQAREYESDVSLPPGTVRFAQAVGRYAKTIGVRGVFTKSVLERYGVTNTVVTGCPSNFITPQVTGSGIAQQIESLRTDGVGTAAHLFGTMEEWARTTEAGLTRLMEPRDSDIIYQTNQDLLRLCHDGVVTEKVRKYLEWEWRTLGSTLSLDDYVGRILRKGRIFSDARTWVDAAGRYDLVVGMRIHGAVAAIQGGGLGVCVAFDARTLELCETMAYPYVLPRNVEAARNIEELLEHVVFSADAFDENRRVLKERFGSLITEAGLTLSHQFMA